MTNNSNPTRSVHYSSFIYQLKQLQNKKKTENNLVESLGFLSHFPQFTFLSHCLFNTQALLSPPNMTM